MGGQDDGEMPSSPYTAIGSTVSVVSRQGSPSKNGPQYFAAFAATLGNLIMGTCIGWSSPAGPLLKDGPAEDGFNMSDQEISWVGCLMPAGALLGGQLGGLFMSKLGRKGGMMVCSTLFCLSLLLLAAAQNTAMVYIGRFCTGVCTGITSIICPTYVAETATADKRGFLGSCVQLMVTIGVLEVIVVGVCGSWRWLTISCLVMCLLWIGCLFFVPETPVYYLTQKKYREAREALEWLRGTDNVEEEFELIVKGLDESAQAGSAGPLDLFKHGNLAPFVISMWLMLGQQFSGMNAVMFYAVAIFEDTGSSMNSNVENIIIGLVQVVSTVIAALVMDKLGRRILLLLSAGLMVISISLLGLYFFINENLGEKTLAAKISWLPVTSLSVFVSVFSIGFGPIPWLMMSELFSPEVKSVASSISTTFNWTLAFLVTKFFSNMVVGVTEAGSFWMFGGFTVLTFLFCLLFVPETKGKSLEEIQRLFRSDQAYYLSIGPWKCLRGEPSEDTRPIVQDDLIQS